LPLAAARHGWLRWSHTWAGASDARIAGNTPVLVVMTDGRPSQVPYAEDGTVETTDRRAAQGARDAGITVFTIGLGAPEDINDALLKECASGADRYYYAPNGEDLATIYAQIAYSFGCPSGRHNWMAPWP
jgi:Mg-chelatase subunit ChlD